MMLADPWATEEADTPDAYVPSPTVEDFMLSTANGPVGQRRLLILSGPRGEGKTTAGLMACVGLAEALARDGYGDCLPLRIAVVRDTWVNLERTTIISFEETRSKGLPITWKDGHKEAIVTFDPERPHCHFYFFGIDNPDDADKFQGFPCGVLWLEEVASAAGLSGGIPADTFGIGVTSLRQPGVPRLRVLVTMNPPDEDHWILRVEEELHDRGIDFFVTQHWRIPAGEKSEHFRRLAEREADQAVASGWAQAADEFDKYRQLNRAALEAIGRSDLVARLVEGQVGSLKVGEPVVPNFSAEHIAKVELRIYKSLVVYRCWDNEPSVGCALFQILPDGNGLNVLGSHAIENLHMEGFIDAWLSPFMQKYHMLPPAAGSPWGRGSHGGLRYEDVGDPVLLNTQLTAGLVINRKLGASLIPGAVDWEERRGSALACFARNASHGGRRFVQIDPTENALLLKGLKGDFRFPRQASTNVATMTPQAAKRISGLCANVCDALFYGMAHKFPADQWLRRHQMTPAPRTPVPRASTFMGA